jgi:uncharacterized protein (DUF2141 family)
MIRSKRTMLVAAGLLGAALPGAAQPGLAQTNAAALKITVTGIGSAKGLVRVALCPPQAGFPDCKARVVRSASLPIKAGQAEAEFEGLAPGTYAVSVFHDENSNGKLDRFMGIPKEGYGFSRNPGFKPRAPKFSEAEITVTGRAAVVIKLRYIL